ncbi:MAG: tetratricopeptide repeat protein [Anaerolineae bacterium]
MTTPDTRRLMRDWLATVELLLAALAGAWWYTQGGAVWYAGPWPGPLPLTLLGAMWILRLVRTRGRLKVSAFALPLALFLVSTGVGLWAAYDPGPAWAKAWLIVGALGIYQALTGQPDLIRLYVAYGFWGLFGVVLTVYFLMTNDWAAYPIKVPLLTTLGQTLSEWLPSLTAHRIHPNVAGGMLAVALPLYAPLILLPARGAVCPKHRRLLTVAASLGMMVALLGWLVTTSRGAWSAALAAGLLWGLWRLLWRIGPRVKYVRQGASGRHADETHSSGQHVPAQAVPPASGVSRPVSSAIQPLTVRVAFVLLVFTGALAAVGIGSAILAYELPGAAQLANRLRLLRLGYLLARDVPYTGVGLGMFEIPFSVYTLLIHVGYINHSHNMLLDMTIEQGVLGAVGYVAMAAVAVGYWVLDVRYWMLDSERPELPGVGGRTSPDSGRQLSRVSDDVSLDGESETRVSSIGDRVGSLLIEAPMVSLTALLIHGLVDDALYGSRGVLLLFVPFGLLVAARSIVNQGSPVTVRRMPRSRPGRAIALVLLLTLGVLGTIVLIKGGPVGAWHADLGAVAQARVELNVYDSHRFNELSIQAVRRQEDLSAAIAHFERAMTLSTSNPTARHRMAQILLARHVYDAALRTIEGAWDAGHRDRVTRLLYGDALVAAGRVDEAIAVLNADGGALEFARARLLGQAWGYHQAGDRQREAWAREAAERVSE